MSKYIDKDELKDNIKALWNWETIDGISATTVLKQTLRDIDNMPCADVVEVRHGHWEFIGGYGYQYRCSVCVSCAERKTKFCSNCGAKMDEVSE